MGRTPPPLSGDRLVTTIHEAAATGTPAWEGDDIPPGQPLAQEWRVFTREVQCLIERGDAGRFAMVAGESLTVWDSLSDALQAAQLVHPGRKVLVQEVRLSGRPLRLRRAPRCPG